MFNFESFAMGIIVGAAIIGIIYSSIINKK